MPSSALAVAAGQDVPPLRAEGLRKVFGEEDCLLKAMEFDRKTKN